MFGDGIWFFHSIQHHIVCVHIPFTKCDDVCLLVFNISTSKYWFKARFKRGPKATSDKKRLGFTFLANPLDNIDC